MKSPLTYFRRSSLKKCLIVKCVFVNNPLIGPSVTAISSAGWQHHPTVAEDCQEDSARGGLEEDTGGPEGHGGSPSAA